MKQYNFTGIKAACTMTRDICSKNGYGWRVAIYVNTKTNDVTTWAHPSCNEWQVVRDKNIRYVMDARYPMTMAEIKQAVIDKLEYLAEE